MQPYRLALPTGLGVGDVNAYLFTTPEPILVDTGIKREESWLALEEGLAQHGLAVTDLSRVVITHPHVDHYGQAGTIAAKNDAEVWISQLGVPWLETNEDLKRQRVAFYRDYFLPSTGLTAEAMAMVLAGIEALDSQSDPIPSSRIRAFSPQGKLQMGGRAWEVIHTPGHASMQTCFYDPANRILLSADMLLSTTPTPVVEGPPDGSWNRIPALPQFLQSLDKLEQLEIDTVLPGHGRPFGDHRAVIRRQRERINLRKAECLSWIHAGYHTPAALLPQMYAHQPSPLRLTGLWMLVGYLDLLEAEGAVRQEVVGGVAHYYTSGLEPSES
jgi:glyoxylase-like metal-dependent hydrolase (beta-lactamase superfamily II)